MSDPVIYTVGGTVQAGGGVYIRRQADDELLNLCRSRTFAYVLTPRQMGKSSLMVQTAHILQAEGVRTVVIDLTEIGTQATPEEWYLGLLTLVEDQLDIEANVLDWWEDHSHLGFTQRLTRFFKEVVLVEIKESIVVFIDEIDTTLSLNFTDDFFVAIRYFYTARAQHSDFMRLSFVLIGVASPGDLIQDRRRTPFNIGQRVDLEDFSFIEAIPLADSLHKSSEKAKVILKQILDWTGGHPYLTQRACQVVCENKHDLTEKTVNELIKKAFISGDDSKDNNLMFVRDMLLERSPSKIQTLKIYRIIRKGKPVFDEDQSPTKNHLKLSGIVKREGDKLLLRNKVYKENFNDKWIKDNLPVDGYVPPTPKSTFLVSSMGAYAIVLMLRFIGFWQPGELYAYDIFNRFSQKSSAGEKITLIGITENDIEKYGWPLSDEIIASLLKKLQSYQPSVIGLDIYRNEFRPPGTEHLKVELDAKNVIAIMNVGTSRRERGDIPPPPSIEYERIGFNDFPNDPDGVIRRNLIFVRGSDKNFYSFGLRVAMSHLGLSSTSLSYDEEKLLIDKSPIPVIAENSGGYSNIDSSGYQIIIRYINSESLTAKLSVEQILENDFNPDQITGKVVLIGALAPSLNDSFYVPTYERKMELGLSGTEIHAQIISQLLDIVSGERAKIYYLPGWFEYILIAIFALTGAFLTWRIRYPILLILTIILILFGSYFFALGAFWLVNIWFPVVEPLAAFVLSIMFTGSTFYYYSVTNKLEAGE